MGNRGAALLIAVIVSGVMTTLAFSYLAIVGTQLRSTGMASRLEQALQAADAAISLSIDEIASGDDADGDGLGTITTSFAGFTVTVVAVDNGDGTWTLTATASDGAARQAIEVTLAESEATGPFSFGAFGDEWVDLDSNSLSDSYDSRLGTYASQISDRLRGHAYARTSGHVGSNGPVHLDSNALLMGDAVSGPTRPVTLDANAHVHGSVSCLRTPMELPPVVLPPEASMQAECLAIRTNRTASLPPGSYHFSSLTTDSNASLVITGPATIVADHFNVNSNSSVTFDTSAGPIQFYGTGTFHIDSNASVSSANRIPGDLRIYISTDNVANPDLPVEIDSNSSLYAAVYAPRASLTLDSNGELYGAVVGRRVNLDSNFRLHYDEALGADGGRPGLRMVASWVPSVPIIPRTP